MASKELPCSICFRCFNGVLRLFIVEYKIGSFMDNDGAVLKGVLSVLAV
jgi:hypothetical protein